MSRKPARIKLVNLEEGMPTLDRARLRMEHELQAARAEGFTAVKLIHGYGSSGQGGVLRIGLQQTLRRLAADSKIAAFIPGEDWRVSGETAWEWIKRYPEWKDDSDFGRSNRGISIVIF